jgi:hypothetical protein
MGVRLREVVGWHRLCAIVSSSKAGKSDRGNARWCSCAVPEGEFEVPFHEAVIGGPARDESRHYWVMPAGSGGWMNSTLEAVRC